MEEYEYCNDLTTDHGAFDSETGEYSLPEYAIKSRNYTCPECSQKLILKKGKIKRHHFAHYSQEMNCNFYNINNVTHFNKIHEGLLHKTAKLMLKKILEESGGKKIHITRNCATNQCNNYDLVRLNIDDKTTFQFEQTLKFENRNIRPDLIWLQNNEVKYIFELYDTSKTKEYNRPDDIEWFEFKAFDIIKRFKERKFENEIQFICMRDIIKCQDCIKRERIRLQHRIERERKQHLEKEKEIKRLLDEEIKYRTTCQKCYCSKANNIYKFCYQCNVADKNKKCKLCGKATKYELYFHCHNQKSREKQKI